MFISQPFEEFKFITPKSLDTRTYFDTKLSRFGLAGNVMVTILEFKMLIYQLLKELKC